MPDTTPVVSLVVSTIGRPDMLARLVRSVVVEAASTPLELLVADQSRDRSAAAIVAAHAAGVPHRVIPSGGGVSRGRNEGLAIARGAIVSFPDDDCWYPGTTLARAVALLDARPDLVGVTTQMQSVDGRPNMLRWKHDIEAVSLANYYRTSIGPTVIARTAAVRATGGYDERIGPGAGTPMGSCEDADVLLRLLEQGTVEYHPELRVGHDRIIATLEASVADKMYGYGVGQAWLWRRYSYPRHHVGYLLARKAAKVAGGIATGRREHVRPDAAFLRGAVAGLTGRVDVGT